MTERASLQVGLKPGIARYQQASHKVEMGRNWSSWVGGGGGDNERLHEIEPCL